MSETTRDACPVCGGRRLRPLPRYARAHLVRCEACGLTSAGLMATDGTLEGHYEDYGHAWFDSPITRRRYGELLDSFERYRRTNRLLEFGCGAGYFLQEAREHGWEVFGNDLSARAKQLDVVHGPITADTFEPGSFDVITAFEVFEHLRDPHSEAGLLARLLRPGGLLYCAPVHSVVKMTLSDHDVPAHALVSAASLRDGSCASRGGRARPPELA